MYPINNVPKSTAKRPTAERYLIVWSQDYLQNLERIASGEEAGFSEFDRELAPLLLLCSAGEFDRAEERLLALLQSQTSTVDQNSEIYFSFLHCLFVVQRLDIAGALLKRRFGFPRPIHLRFEDSDIGIGCVRWDISPEGNHTFVFDAASLRRDDTRTHVLQFMWEFPLLTHYAAQADQEFGSVYINQNDVGLRPGLAYCDNRPDYFLIPDYIFVPSHGYQYAREVLATRPVAWRDKTARAFWRGGTTGVPTSPGDWKSLERIKLVELARSPENSAIMDVGLSSIVQIPDESVIQWIRNSGLLSGPVPWQDWGNFRYLIDIDGNSSPWSNLFQRFLSGSCVLKVESRRGLRQWFYDDLKPWFNYVPIAPDLSDLPHKVKWLSTHDDLAKRIAGNGYDMATTLTYERELRRSVPVISSAFRYFRGAYQDYAPFGNPDILGAARTNLVQPDSTAPNTSVIPPLAGDSAIISTVAADKQLLVAQSRSAEPTPILLNKNKNPQFPEKTSVLQHISAIRPLSQDLGYQGTYSRTIGCYWTVPANTKAIVLCHGNYYSGGSSTIQSAYAISSALGNGVDPLDRNGQSQPNVLFRNVTWSGATHVEIAAAPVDKRVPTLVYSDEMPLLETDGSLELSGKILFVRDYSRGGHSADRFDANTPSLRESSRYGFGGGWVNTETESTPGHFINPGHFHDAAGPGWVCVGFHVPHALLCITDSPAITILQTGDSINSGVSSSNGLLSPAWYAAELLRGTIGMSTHVVNQALSGDISHNYIRRAQFSLTGLQPSVAVIQTYSRNDQVVFGDTIGVAKAAYDRALDLRAQCQAFGILPILETSCPFAGRSAFETFETNRNFINGLVRGSGHPFVDYDVILGSGGVPNAFLPGLSEDGIHPTTNGIKQMGQALFDVIRTHRLQMKFGGF